MDKDKKTFKEIIAGRGTSSSKRCAVNGKASLKGEDRVALCECIDYYLNDDGHDYTLAKSLMDIVVEKALSGNEDFKKFFMDFFSYDLNKKQFKRWGDKVLSGEEGSAELGRPFFNSDYGFGQGEKLFTKMIKSALEGNEECKISIGYILTNRENRPDDHAMVVLIPPLKTSEYRRVALSSIMNHPWSV